MKIDISVDRFNDQISRLGYGAVCQRDFLTLSCAFGLELMRWTDAVLRQPGEKTADWHSLRSALFSVSQSCHEALIHAGIDAPPLRLAKWLVQRGEQGRQMIRFVGRDAKDRNALAVRDELRSALCDSAGTESRVPPDIKARTTRVFGSRYALTVEQSWNVHGQASLQFEMARKSKDGIHFDWADKIAVMLADHEVLGVVDVISGRTDAFDVRHHGDARDKSLRLEAQPDKDGIYVNLRRAELSYGVLVPRYQVFRVLTLATRALALNSPGMSSEEILGLAKVIGSRFSNDAAVSA